MASDDDSRIPLIDPSTSPGSAHARYTDPIELTAIDMTPAKTKPSDNEQGLKKSSKKKRSPIKDIFMINISDRLDSRKKILTYISFVTDLMCLLALSGIVLMIVENEITFTQINNRETITTWILKLIITITTIILLILVLVYHRLDLAFYASRHQSPDWHIGLTWTRMLLIVVELVVCAVHPVVPAFPQEYNMKIDNATLQLIMEHAGTYTPVEAVLSLLMFLRLYLVLRFALYHSRLTRHIGSQSVGYLNQVSISFSFLIKTYLAEWPIICLCVFCVSILLIGSWSLRTCDYNPATHRIPILGAVWYFIQIFTTLGYGDKMPISYCSKTISALIAFLGVLASALLINVVAQKVLLNRWENYVHTYALNTELAKNHKNEAANIVKYTIRLWMWKQNPKTMSNFQVFRLRRKLFHSIHNIHEIKNEQRDLVDKCIGLPEVQNVEHRTNTITQETMRKVTKLEAKIENVEGQLTDVKQSINNIENILNRLADRIA